MKTQYICSNCQNTFPKWMGKCSSCNEWNTLVEEVVEKKTKDKKSVWKDKNDHKAKPLSLSNISPDSYTRISFINEELNRVLGGGLVPGSLVLIGGEPGIGKSTLILQLSLENPIKILYVSGEESGAQIKMRAERMGLSNESCFIYAETNINRVFTEAKKMHPDILVIDSIQTVSTPYLESSPGSIAQVRECTNELQRFAKENNIACLIIGHINKEGSIAGPKLLEHMVDTVLQFEGDKNYNYRILRSLKNRFGSTDEIGIYEMTGKGLRGIDNPSQILLSQSDEDLSGSCTAATIHGGRPLLLETQALVSTAVYGNPQRSTTGFDLRRMNMLLAVLEKRVGLPFSNKDVFLNIAGGLRVGDPALDLSIAAALCSSLHDIHISRNACFAAELGLTGEIRAVNKIDQRIAEANRLGFETIYISSFNEKSIDQKDFDIEIKPLKKINEMIEILFT